MKKTILICYFLLILLSLYAPTNDYQYDKTYIAMKEQQLEKERLQRMIELEKSEFNYDNLVEYLHLVQMKNAKIVLKQAILESGWFQSESFTQYNNLFGMKHPNIRETTSIGKALKHAKYTHWTQSVQDYVLWQKYYTDYFKRQNKTFKDYYKFLANAGYAEDDSYIYLLKRINIPKYGSITNTTDPS